MLLGHQTDYDDTLYAVPFQLEIESVLAKPLEHQCSDATTSPATGTDRLRSPPRAELEALAVPGRTLLIGATVLPVHSLRPDSDDASRKNYRSLASRAAVSTSSMCGTQLFASATSLIRGQILPPSEMKSLLYGSTARSPVLLLSKG